jgi:hypothetical protein
LRSARAARLPLVSLELPEPIVLLLGELDELELLPEVEGLAPIVPLLLLGELDELELLDGVLDEPEEPVVEPEVDGEAEEPEEPEPLAPIDVPLLLGVLAEELELSLEPLLALGLLLEELLGVLLLEELLGLVLEPEAPIVPVDGVVVDGDAPPAAAPGPDALLVPADVPPLVVPPLEAPPAELWAMA